MRRLLWTRQRDRGDVYIYMRLSQCNGTILLFRPDLMWRLSFICAYVAN